MSSSLWRQRFVQDRPGFEGPLNWVKRPSETSSHLLRALEVNFYVAYRGWDEIPETQAGTLRPIRLTP